MFRAFVGAVYETAWFTAQVEREDPEEECKGSTLLKYMIHFSHKQFVWEKHMDSMKTTQMFC